MKDSLEALENIAITFDEGGYEPTTLGAKSGHFIEVFGDDFNTIKQELERLEKLEEEYQELKNKYEKLKTKYSNIRKYPPINQALMNYDEIDWEILKDEYGEEVFENES